MSNMDMSTRDRDRAGARHGTRSEEEIPRKRTFGGFALVAYVIAEVGVALGHQAEERPCHASWRGLGSTVACCNPAPTGGSVVGAASASRWIG